LKYVRQCDGAIWTGEHVILADFDHGQIHSPFRQNISLLGMSFLIGQQLDALLTPFFGGYDLERRSVSIASYFNGLSAYLAGHFDCIELLDSN
jgi:hypothetical protein